MDINSFQRIIIKFRTADGVMTVKGRVTEDGTCLDETPDGWHRYAVFYVTDWFGPIRIEPHLRYANYHAFDLLTEENLDSLVDDGVEIAAADWGFID